MIADVQTLEQASAAASLARADPARRETANTSGNERPRILAILPRGEAIRNFVYTGALDEVAKSVDVHLLSVVPGDDFYELLRARYGHVRPLKEISESRVVEGLREIYDMAHGRWLWSQAAQHRWRFHDAEARASGKLWQRTIKKIACRAFAHRAGLKLLSRIERVTSRRLRTTDEYVSLLSELKPTLVFNSSHVHSRVATQAVQAAQWLGIPTATFIFSWDNLTSQGRIMQPYDYYLVWNEALRKQLLEIYDSVQAGQVFVTGTPQFDFHFKPEFYWTRAEFCARTGADPARPIVLYSTGMANHMPGEPLIVEGIARMLREMTDLSRPQLLVRVYPKDQTGRFREVARRNPDILFPAIPWESRWQTPRLEDAHLLTNMLRHAAAGVNIASTVSLELCMLDKPVVNVGYNPREVEMGAVDYAEYYRFDHYRPVVESGGVEVAASESEMRALLRKALTKPEARCAERRALIERMFGETLDGSSGKRVATRLVKLVEREAAMRWRVAQTG